MSQKPAQLVPSTRSLTKLRSAAAICQACDLWKTATQTVFGEGPTKAEIMFVGEQPGELEDRSGHPFVGPAGKLFDRALAETSLQRSDVYVTNVVKHFKWSLAERGKRLLCDLTEPHQLRRSNLHEYRLKVKELRNLLLMAENADKQPFVGHLGQLKDAIGEWHDWEILVAIADDALNHGKNCRLIENLQDSLREI